MDSSAKKQTAALQAALKTARENENRWMEFSAEFATDAERMEQWTSTARLRRLEVERIEALLVGDDQHVCNEMVDMNDGLGESA